MNFGSVCSGIEAASVAWHPLGWRAAWLAEIEDAPSEILKHHYPDVPNLGDMTKIAAAVRAGIVEAPDVLVGGTPCQAFSVAGLRGGLADERGALTLSFVRLADAIDAARSVRGKPPAVIVWENVPGVLSDKTNAFGCLLGGLAGAGCELQPPGGKWGRSGCVYGPQRAVAWRVLDAQYFGVAQRRRRVFVVASARPGFDPAAVLLEWDGARRDSAPSREAREGIAEGAASGADGRRWPAEIASTLNAAFGSKLGLEDQHIGGGRRSLSLATMAHGQGNAEIAEDRSPTLTCNHEAPILFHGGGFDDVAHTLRGEGFDASEDGTGRGTPLVPVALPLEIAGDIRDDDYVSPRFRSATEFLPQSSRVYSEHETSPTLQAAGARMGNRAPQVQQSMQVRRLTPRECERLQGFPDDYTRIPERLYKAKPSGKHFQKYPDLYDRLPDGRWVRYLADGPRYKALGNSMAVPVMRWIGSRIAGALAMPVPANDNQPEYLEIPAFLRRGTD